MHTALEIKCNFRSYDSSAQNRSSASSTKYENPFTAIPQHGNEFLVFLSYHRFHLPSYIRVHIVQIV